jgi:hypothetical protein
MLYFFIFMTILMALLGIGAILANWADSYLSGVFEDIGEFTDDEEIG